MKNYLKALLSIILLASCTSENEQKGLDEIATVYHAKVAFSKGFYTNTNQKTIKNFTIKISDCKMLDTIKFGQASANMARIAYANFTAKEKKKYDEINVEFITEKDTAYASFDNRLLKLIDKKGSTALAFSESILHHNFSKLDELIDKNHIRRATFGLDMKKYITSLEKTRGKINTYQLYAISKTRDENAKINMIRYMGEFEFSGGKKAAYFVNIDMLEDKDKIIGYKLD
ncbi:hypothetical protein [Lutibacter sp.]